MFYILLVFATESVSRYLCRISHLFFCQKFHIFCMISKQGVVHKLRFQDEGGRWSKNVDLLSTFIMSKEEGRSTKSRFLWVSRWSKKFFCQRSLWTTPEAIVFNLNFERKVIWSGHSIVVTAGPPEGGDW